MRTGRRSVEEDELGRVPFVFQMPKSVKELSALLAPYSTDVHPTVLARILACHNVHLKPENRPKLKV